MTCDIDMITVRHIVRNIHMAHTVGVQIVFELLENDHKATALVFFCKQITNHKISILVISATI